MERSSGQSLQTHESSQPSGEESSPGRGSLTGRLARQVSDPSGSAHAPAESALSQVQNSSGIALPENMRGNFERSLGTDLSDVRLHTGGSAGASAESLNARAFTFGRDVYFGSGQYDPGSKEGQRLIAHEVAHTVQQGRGGPTIQNKLEVSSPGDACESEADAAAESMIEGRAAVIGSFGGVHRQIMRQPMPHPAPPAAAPPAAPAHPGPQAVDNGMITQDTPVTFSQGRPRQATLTVGTYVEVLLMSGSTYHVRVPSQHHRECDIPSANFRQQPEIATRERDPNRSSDRIRYTAIGGQAFVGPPSEADVRQNGIGDCTLHSAAIAVIHSGHGARLQQIIVPQGAGWMVTLHRIDRSHPNPNGSFPIVPWSRFIDNYFPDNTHRSDNTGEAAMTGPTGALWPLILEKAYARMQGGYQVFDNDGYDDPDYTHNQMAMIAITGQYAQRDHRSTPSPTNIMTLPNGQLIPRLRQLLAAGNTITMGTGGGGIRGDVVRLSGGTILFNGHSYALQSIDASDRAHLTNPHGQDHPRPLSEAELRQYFGSCTVGHM